MLYLEVYIQPVGDLVLPCNTFRMLVSLRPTAATYVNQFYPSPSTHEHLKQRERAKLGPCQSVLAIPKQSTESAARSIDGCPNNGSIDRAARSIHCPNRSIAQFCDIDRSAPSINRDAI